MAIDDELDDDQEDEDEEPCGACDGLEEFMLEDAWSWPEGAPIEEGGHPGSGSEQYVFGWATRCEECGRGIDTGPAMAAYEEARRERQAEAD